MDEGDRSVEDNQVLTQQTVDRVNAFVQNKLKGTNSKAKKYLDLNYQSGGIKAYLSDISSDKDHIYLNINLKNSGGVIFEQDYTTVFYENRRQLRGGNYSNKQAYNVDVFPTYSDFNDNGIIKPGEVRTVSLAIPIFAISSNSKFKVIVYEKNGFRNITFSIRGSKLNRILKRNRQ